MMHRRWAILGMLIVAPYVARVAIGQEARDHPFSGRVVDASAKAVAGATVRMLSLKTSGDGLEYEVDVSTKSDAQGRFQLAVPKRWLRITSNHRQELGIVAVHEMRMAGILISRTSLPKEGLELEMPAPGETAMVVRSPDGAPVRGAVVAIDALQADQVDLNLSDKEIRDYAGQIKKSRNGYVVSRSMIVLPAELRVAAGTTDEMGRVDAPIAASQIAGVTVKSAEFGEQSVMIALWRGQRNFPGWPGLITLQPVGRVQGQLVGNAKSVAGREVTIATHTESNDQMRGGRAKVRTDAEGKFEVAKIAVGSVHALVDFDPKAPDRMVGAKKPLQVKTGAALELKIDLKPAVHLTGVVLNAETKRPVADVHVLAGSDQQVTSSMTDADGRFAVWVAPGKASIVPLIPEGFLDPVPPDKYSSPEHRAASVKEIDVAGKAVELPPILLLPEATLRGVVVDDRGQPLGGTTVSAISLVLDRRYSNPRHREVSVTAGERGEFAVTGIDPRVEIRLRAQAKEAFKIVTIAKPGTDPVRIAIAPSDVFRVRGRVVDAAGNAVPDANLELWRREWRPPPSEAEPKKAAGPAIRTDATGKFTTPLLLPDGQYRFVVRAAGVRTMESAWLDATLPDATKSQELTVTRLGGLAGVLRDRQGNPIADAQVTLFSRDLRVETATSAQGEFKLETPSGKPFCIIARRADFRVHGAFYEKDPAQLDQVLSRVTEATEKRTPRTILAKEEREKLLQQLLAPYKQEFLKAANLDEKYRGAVVLAKVDPAFLLEYLDKNPLKPAMMQDGVLQFIVKQWASRKSDDAEEVIGKMQTAYVKAMALCDLADGQSEQARARKLDLLAEALVAARTEKSPEFRAFVLGITGRRLFDLGEKDHATAVLREGEKLANSLSTDALAGYARGSFATDLALVDLPAALALVKGLKDPSEFRRHHGNIAHRIAGMQPAAAVKVLDLIPGPKANEFNQRDHYAIRVCYRLARVDLPRARALAESIVDVASRAHALGVMAQAVAGKDPKTATELLRRAYSLLEEEAARPDPPQLTSPLTPASVAAVLIFSAEAIDATLVDECVWRAVALQRTPTEDSQKVWRYQTANNALAMAVARYNTGLADFLLPPASRMRHAREGPLANFLVNPQLTARAAGKAPMPQELQERLELIGFVGTDEDQFPRLIHHTLGMWWIDVEDHDF